MAFEEELAELERRRAHALAMGGAFLGVADDVSTVFSNPAGLRLLARPEAVGMFPVTRVDSTFAVRGHLFGPPSGIGVDTIPGVQMDSRRHEFVWRPVHGAFAIP